MMRQNVHNTWAQYIFMVSGQDIASPTHLRVVNPNNMFVICTTEISMLQANLSHPLGLAHASYVNLLV